MDFKVRHAVPEDLPFLLNLHRDAFGGDVEASLIQALIAGNYLRSSLVAEVEGRIVGHILFSEVILETNGESIPVLALAPMAVHPEQQSRGIGLALVQEGLEHCHEIDFPAVFVLGHPDFYEKSGFSPELAARFASPYSGPSFMAIELVPGFLKGKSGQLRYSQPFIDLET